MRTSFTNDGINWYLSPGCTFKVLDNNEVLKGTDLCRELYEDPMMSQDGGWDTTYKDRTWRGTQWHSVNTELTAWIGKTFQDYLIFCGNRGYVEYEIIRVVE